MSLSVPWTGRLWRCGLLLSWLLLSVPGSARAQAPSAADDRAQSFEAVSGAVKEDIAGGPLMLAAYAFVWFAVFGYGFRLVRLHRSIEVELARVERAVETAAKSGARS